MRKKCLSKEKGMKSSSSKKGIDTKVKIQINFVKHFKIIFSINNDSSSDDSERSVNIWRLNVSTEASKFKCKGTIALNTSRFFNLFNKPSSSHPPCPSTLSIMSLTLLCTSALYSKKVFNNKWKWWRANFHSFFFLG